MITLLAVVAIFVVSVVIGSAIGSVLGRLVLGGMQRGLAVAERTMPTPPNR